MLDSGRLSDVDVVADGHGPVDVQRFAPQPGPRRAVTLETREHAR